jgi:hypothetical protein
VIRTCCAWRRPATLQWAPDQLRAFRGMTVIFDDGGAEANVAFLTAWMRGYHPVQLLALSKKDKKAVQQMIVNVSNWLSAPIGRFSEVHARQA